MTTKAQGEMDFTPTIDDINAGLAVDRATKLEWAPKMGLEVNEEGEIRNPETNKRVLLTLRKTPGGVTQPNVEPMVHDYPTENVPDLSVEFRSDAGAW